MVHLTSSGGLAAIREHGCEPDLGSPRNQNGCTPVNRLLLFACLASSVTLSAQDSIPAGTVLPVALNSTLNTRKLKPGQRISATVMQEVPASDALVIPIRSQVLGRVVEVSPPSSTGGANLTVQFDTLLASRRRIPIHTNLRAMASMMDVHAAQIPSSGPDRGTSDKAWTTNQIGGEVVYRGGGPVARGLEEVGKPVPNGVLARTSARLGTQCRAEVGGNDRLQALWVFSSDACGLYGLAGVNLVHAGRSHPTGKITFAADRGELNLRSGSGLLLRVIEPGP